MSISIRIGGRVASTYFQNNLTFVEGRKGSEYQLIISNPFNVRAKAVVSVDGLNVISGELCDYNDKGYILNPYQSLAIDGWRISDQAVRAFKFGNDSESYGSLSGQGTNNNGVIGVAIFKEKQHLRSMLDTYVSPYVPSWETDFTPRAIGRSPLNSVTRSFSKGLVDTNGPLAMNSLACIGASAADPSIGTGQGSHKTSRVTKVEFEHEQTAASVETLYYDTYDGLVRRGVIQRPNVVPPLPSAFPANTGYAKSF